MKLTPLDIRKQEFRKTLRGFDPIEVQTFLEMVGEEYEQLLEKNKQLNHRLIELETKLKDYQENEKNLRETLLNVQEVKKQSEESSRRQADLLIKESELKALEIIEIARKQARQMRDEVSILRSQKESFINRIRQILISQIELLSVLEIDDAIPEEAMKFLDNVSSRRKMALASQNNLREMQEKKSRAASGPDEAIEMADGPSSADVMRNIKAKIEPGDNIPANSASQSNPSRTTGTSQPGSEKNKEPDLKKKVDDEINEFFKKEIQIDELMKDIQKKNKK
jgi:cell division initiation protein